MAITSIFRPRKVTLDGEEITKKVSSVLIRLNAGELPKVELSIVAYRVSVDADESVTIRTVDAAMNSNLPPEI